MFLTRWVLISAFLLAIPAPTLQVSIWAEWWLEGYSILPVSALWDDISPGTCLRPQPNVVPSDVDAGQITFSNLLGGQYGAGWTSTGPNHADIPECDGMPALRLFGLGMTQYDQREGIEIYSGDDSGDDTTDDDLVHAMPENIIFAAAWYDLRTRFPPNSADARYLQWQGVNGAVWGKSSLNAASGGIPFGSRKRSYGDQRLNGFAQQGTLTISTPMRGLYPTMWRFNGTNYTDTGNAVYTSEDGRVLNLSSIANL